MRVFINIFSTTVLLNREFSKTFIPKRFIDGTESLL